MSAIRFTPSTVNATEIGIDLRRNRIHIKAPAQDSLADSVKASEGIIDIGAQGRLLGVEIGDMYVAVMEDAPTHDNLTRSVLVPLTVELTGTTVTIVVGRRGSDWEISYPSGNQCWTRKNVFDRNGAPLQVCAVVIPATSPAH